MEPKSHEKPIKRWCDSFLLWVIPPLAAALIRGLMLSCRVVRIEGKEAERRALEKSGGGAVYATWHQRMSYHFHHFGRRHVTMMISQSRDGEYAARVAGLLGFKNVRGSSTKRGKQALKEMIALMRQGEIGGMLADGPLGPARVAKMGSITMARNAQVPLIGVVWGADRCWVFNSWDRYMVPKPFARVVIAYNDPIWIPKSADRRTLESYRQLFEKQLNDGTRRCDLYFGSERPWRKTPPSPTRSDPE